MKKILGFIFLISIILAETSTANQTTTVNAGTTVNNIDARVDHTVPKKTYFSKKLDFTISCPITWNMDTTSKSYTVMFYPEETPGDVYVAVKAYISYKVVTADGLYFRRSGTIWDGWHLLGVKNADEKMNFLIGSDEKISAIYSKVELGHRLTMTKTIVGEDIYVKNEKNVVIVTAKAEKSKWLKFLNGIGFIKKNFYFENNNG